MSSAPPLDLVAELILDGVADDQVVQTLIRDGHEPSGVVGLRGLQAAARLRRTVIDRVLLVGPVLEAVAPSVDEAARLEQRVLFADPDDLARFEEAELRQLPGFGAMAYQVLARRRWRSAAAAESFARARTVVTDSVHRVLVDRAVGRWSRPDPADLTAMIAAVERCAALISTPGRRAGPTSDVLLSDDLEPRLRPLSTMITNRPPAERTLDRLVDELAWRRSAHQRLLSSLDERDRDRLTAAWHALIEPEPRLTTLVDLLHRHLDLLHRHDDPLRHGERWAGHLEPAGYLFADLIDPIAETADLDQLDRGLVQDYPGASIDDLDEDTVARLLGHQAESDLANLRRLARTLAAAHDAPRQARRRLPTVALRRALTPDLRRRLATLRDDSEDPEAIVLVIDRAGADQTSWAAARAAAQVVPAILSRRGPTALPIVLVIDKDGAPKLTPFAAVTAQPPPDPPHSGTRPVHPADSPTSTAPAGPPEPTAQPDSTVPPDSATRLDPTQWIGPIRRAVSRAGAARAVIMIIGSDRPDRVLNRSGLRSMERFATHEGWVVGLVQLSLPGPDARDRVTIAGRRSATFLINHLAGRS